MVENVLSKEELEALLHDYTDETMKGDEDPRLESGDKDKLLHAVVRNQLRLLRMIDDLQLEIQTLRSQLYSVMDAGTASEAAVSIEPMPLPFMGRRNEEQKDDEPGPLSRKERYKKQSKR
ncbi:hypothetical protein [Paenibacillus thermotolerans]|uniref:hypothetical protein n=1 Tax=Paenibacillus thermotolerans TaxID=3027807 RepID=UPI0023686384|nr:MULTISPECIES: hypothetical protein [unclassified Paenibacillus]